jgi:hypothetical protein
MQRTRFAQTTKYRIKAASNGGLDVLSSREASNFMDTL